MVKTLEVLFTPADFSTLAARDLSRSACVVFDILRATSTIVTAIANGSTGVIPVSDIADAVALRQTHPSILLAGERHGLRIRASEHAPVDFDLGNSPREFTPEVVRGKLIGLTTTNGTRALRACHGAAHIFSGAFLNLKVTAQSLQQLSVEHIILVCSGTGEQAAWEDMLCAGAMAELLSADLVEAALSDSTHMALKLWRDHAADPLSSMRYSANGRRLLKLPDLCADVPYCLRLDAIPLVIEIKSGILLSPAKA